MTKKIIFLTYLKITLVATATAQTLTGTYGEKFAVRIVADRLSDPWEIIYGPDGNLWVTEAKGYRVSTINPITGKKTILLDISSQRLFPRYDKLPKEVSGGKPWPQAGLMGMALHPQLLSGKPYIYLAYIYKFAGADSVGNGGRPNKGGYFFTTKIARYTYDARNRSLTNPVSICDTIPGSNDHNGGRLLIAPVNGTNYLFYSTGDMGAGQFNNAGRQNRAQQLDAYEGKILRFNTLPDNDPGVYDRWIPADNPFNTTTTQSAVWSTGHRNPQGLAYAKIAGIGRLYSSEHGPFSDDEINLIEKGKNYGHPLIIGYDEGNYDGLAAGVASDNFLPGLWHTTYPFISSEHRNAAGIGSTYRNPMLSIAPNSHDFLIKLFKDIKGGKEGADWPSEAPSSIEVYTSDAIPGWKNSLLVTTLKGGKIIRMQMDTEGQKIKGDTINYFKSKNRYRDMAISADGEKLYVAVDSTGTTSGPSKENPQQISYKGCIIEMRYLPRPAGKQKKKAYIMPPGRALKTKRQGAVQ
ncbi:hypothetical protein DJ568_00115 [Mucilaginibacter hurinus]|uniref:Glucose/Sorbosone dehydrogenase domain-containing protein n=1 Tax=Mucilaginibacter hurinus TaxID=2201324 RepID=A0A367GU01_9SPHI|nr:PQQ-dependent sugar dehydrogenase [Mucilaginibacter hurinus]RCH56306.1 hypothetical protein DJ568_00115 [Mucilaginibacter hurinus]